MSRRIYKYILEVSEQQTLTIPRNSKLLLIAVQDGRICAWLEVQEEESLNPDFAWTVYIVGTGRQVPHEATQHIGTVQMGPYVWHLYTRLLLGGPVR